MSAHDWFTMTPQTAQAYGRPTNEGFLVRAGSTAMAEGSPNRKRNRPLRDLLIADGILVRSDDPALYRFSQDYVFTSASAAGGVIKDGNCSGPGVWKRLKDGFSLRVVQSRGWKIRQRHRDLHKCWTGCTFHSTSRAPQALVFA